jgi:hypothetical protein
MLKQDWLLDKHIDFEYKQYIVLDYLQKIDDCLAKNELEPNLSELGERLHDLIIFSGKLEEIKVNRKDQELVSLDFYNKRLVYKTGEDHLMIELENIVRYALPLLYLKYDEMIERHDSLLSTITISHLGLFTPSPTEIGYFFLKNGPNVSLYEYIRYPLFDQNEDEFISIRFSKDFGLNNFDYWRMKDEHVAESKATQTYNYMLIITEGELPLEATLLPLCKKKILEILPMASNHL